MWMPTLPALAALLACAHRSRPLAEGEAALSYPQRAAAKLGLVEHQSPPTPDWLREGGGFWVRTTQGDCVLFEGSAEFASHRLCSREEDGWTISTYTHLALRIDPPPFPSAAELPLVEGGYRRKPPPIYGDDRGEGGTELIANLSLATSRTRLGPDGEESELISLSSTSRAYDPRWFLVEADETHARFETLVRAWLMPTIETHPCDRTSAQALAGEEPAKLWYDHAVREGLKHCPTERGADALTERLEAPGGVTDYWPETRQHRRPVDCREPCEPYLGTWEPDPIYIPPGGIPNPLYRDPKPESFLLFRVEAACLASKEPGVLRLPEGERDDPWLHPAEEGPPVIRSSP